MKQVLNIDLDKTLTKGVNNYWEEEPEPDQEMIEKVNNSYKEGNIIIIWTARPWKNAPQAVGWLTKHKVRYHGLKMDKGAADKYIDDKAVNSERWKQ